MAVAYDIPAQGVGSALAAFARQSGLRIAFPASLGAGHQAAALRGTYAPEAALNQLLAGSGLGWRFSGPNSVTIFSNSDDSAAVGSDAVTGDGSVNLGTIILGSGPGSYWDGSAASVYDAPANVDAITRETLETYQITNPADILRGTTGVLSGEARNSGSLNVNIHGLQGQGRVPVTVDGAENNNTVYRGYQGIADRTFVDPDFISSVAIEKGASSARAGIGGAVSVSTLTVDDIVREGRKSGFRLKLSVTGNTSDPVMGTLPGAGADRPSFLNPTGGSASLSYGYKGELVDVVAGFSTRESGNYHAGSNGPREGWVYTQWGGRAWANVSPIGYDGEVPNSSNETSSGLLKVTFRISDDLVWQLGASKYNTKFGEIMPSRYTTIGNASQLRLSGTDLDSLTSRLRWNPEGSDLIDLRWNLWRTAMDSESAPVFDGETSFPESHVKTIGTDISNKARFATAWGDITWTLGASYKNEDTYAVTFPSDGSMIREGSRDEAALFTTGEWQVNEVIGFNAGLRYTRAKSRPKSAYPLAPSPDYDALDYSVGLAVKPVDSLTLFANYRRASRLPSLYEELLQSFLSANPDLVPEEVTNIDIGVNFARDNLFGDDSLRLKLAYFDSDVENYLARNIGMVSGVYSMYFLNIERARFRGFDLSADYQRGGFAAKLGGTYYTDVEFCHLGTCGGNGMGADYTKNQIPPKFQLSLDLSQKLMEDRLTIGGRVSRMGTRASGDPTATLSPNMLIAPVTWRAHTLIDLYAHYNLNDDTSIRFDIQNVTDEYYVEPMSLAPTPGPGRSARLMLDYRF